MKEPPLPLLLAALAGLALGGCGSEKEAERTLGKFEHVFQVCKDETVKQKYDPGKHPCSLVSSMALDTALRDTGIGEDRLAEMRDAWIAQKGFGEYYIAADRR